MVIHILMSFYHNWSFSFHCSMFMGRLPNSLLKYFFTHTLYMFFTTFQHFFEFSSSAFWISSWKITKYHPLLFLCYTSEAVYLFFCLVKRKCKEKHRSTFTRFWIFPCLILNEMIENSEFLLSTGYSTASSELPHLFDIWLLLFF